MPTAQHTILEATLRRLIRRGADAHIGRLVAKSRGEDVGAALTALPEWEARSLVKRLVEDPETAAGVLSNVEASLAANFLGALEPRVIAQIVEWYSSDDAADLMGALPEEQRTRVLAELDQEDAEDVEELLTYAPESAGGIMSTDLLAINVTLTCGEAIQAVQEAASVDVAFYLYIVNEEETLLGVLSLRQIVVHPPGTPVRNIMNSDVISAGVRIDQEDVARLVARYDLLALPVVDDFNKLVGVITVDDVIDVLRDEASEDILKMVGAEASEGSTAASLRARLPWILASMTGGLAAARIIGAFEHLAAFALVVAFVPVLTGLSGNVGIQSSTIIVRGLATGGVSSGSWRAVMFRELSVGLLMSLCCAILVGGFASWTSGNQPRVGIAVSLSVAFVMAFSTTIGATLPLLARRLNIDPAVATGPVLTAALDMVGAGSFLLIASWLLG